MNSVEKRAATVQMRYGVENVSQLESVQAKRRDTFAMKRSSLAIPTLPIKCTIDGHGLQVYRITRSAAVEWLDKYHPLKSTPGIVLCLGLVADDQIYCIIVLKKSRDHRYYAEVARMWTLPTFHVLDGYDILSKAVSDFGLCQLVAYVNRSIENVADYEAIGMKYVRDIQRTRWWVHDGQLMSDASRRQRNLSALQIVEDGWVSVYDEGQAVYEYIE